MICKCKLYHSVLTQKSTQILSIFHSHVSIPVTREGMGFQIRSANPCVVHAVTKGGMAMNAGLVRGQAILKVNLRFIWN